MTQRCVRQRRGLESGFFQWARFIVEELPEECPDFKKSLLGKKVYFGTVCSGVGTPEFACLQLKSAAEEILGSPTLCFQAVHAIEKDTQCQQFLLQQDSDAHLFGDFFELFPGSRPDKAATASSAKKKVAEFEAAFRRDNRITCIRHERKCKLKAVHGSICGSPCQPWSRMGANGGNLPACRNVCLSACVRVRLHMWCSSAQACPTSAPTCFSPG